MQSLTAAHKLGHQQHIFCHENDSAGKRPSRRSSLKVALIFLKASRVECVLSSGWGISMNKIQLVGEAAAYPALQMQ